jgi:hypothetical protein
MAEEKSGGAGSFLANPSTLLAIVTIFGGLWLVSKKLTSDRPVAPGAGSTQFIGDQEFDARLWEDPFKKIVNLGRDGATEGGVPSVSDLGGLLDQLRRRAAKAEPNQGPVLLLPVMLAGGEYSEDTESRIRSRYAIVSALGESGYVPEDSEHIGALKIPWLTVKEVEQAKKNGNSPQVTELWRDRKGPWSPRIGLLGVEIDTHPAQMDLRYEWYSPRIFAAGASTRDKPHTGILILWLDENYFADAPLLRLPLLLDRLANPHGVPQPEIALIGPHSSSTLRNMLPDWGKHKSPWDEVNSSNLVVLAKNVLKRIDLYCATSSAMDEVLVNGTEDQATPKASLPASVPKPRKSVQEELVKVGFKSFNNFASTDAQMADAVFGELELRHVNLSGKAGNTPPIDHVVLISEWDTFYARMLYLTYGAQLALLQYPEKNRTEFINEFIGAAKPDQAEKAEETKAALGYIHSFVYLRGLDGQTVSATAGTPDNGAETAPTDRSRPDSIEDLRHWTPDVNKAEGQGQFDYLGRLGDQMAELQGSLQRSGEQIKAVGIVGSDVYDKLLILQALRPRFPNALFFTTDLDVRLLQPFERDWTRNLLVASSYGLALEPGPQGTVSPFRDSAQTAQFAATKAALGKPDPAQSEKVNPHLFEIGNRTAVALGSPDAPDNSQEPDTQSNKSSSAAAREQARDSSKPGYGRIEGSIAAVVLLLIGACWACDPLQRMTWKALAFPTEALKYSEEDIGGPDGAEALLHRLDDNPGEEMAAQLVDDPPIRGIREKLKWQPVTGNHEIDWKREQILTDLTSVFVNRLNLLLADEAPRHEGPAEAMETSLKKWSNWAISTLNPVPRIRSMRQRYETRRKIDAFLDRVASPRIQATAEHTPLGTTAPKRPRWPRLRFLKGAQRALGKVVDVVAGSMEPSRTRIDGGLDENGEAALQAAVAARQAAQQTFGLRLRRLVCFWGGLVVFGLWGLYIARIVWVDAHLKTGEPFSLTSGTSAWPAALLRIIVFVLAVCLGTELLLKLREAFETLTRKFRLSLPENCKVDSADRVSAESIWTTYCKESRFRVRFPYICLFVAVYFLLLVSIYKASGETVLYPGRGKAIEFWTGASLLLSLFGFLLLAFFTVDAAYRCRTFIKELNSGPTIYPLATRRYFSRQMGRIDDEYLDEWIDLQLIAELTERVDQLVYYPAGLLLLLVLARNTWWDCWTWPIVLIVVYALNFFLSLASVIILQRAAKQAKRDAELSLEAKVKRLQAKAAPSAAQNNATQAEKLLEDIRALNRGAFVPFWENPVVGAIFLSSGGTTLLQVFVLFLGR